MAAIDPVALDLVDFLNASPTAFHAVGKAKPFFFLFVSAVLNLGSLLKSSKISMIFTFFGVLTWIYSSNHLRCERMNCR
jgi:hypothetical protein